jgi:hypothetical protein
LIALQYHDVELRITWDTPVVGDYEVHAQYIYLDTDERTTLASLPQNMVITQTQRSIQSGSAIQEVNYNHPIKYLAAYNPNNLAFINSKLRLQINGTDVTDAKPVNPHYTACTKYYHTTSSEIRGSDETMFLYPFCLETSKLQPTGSLNFSRLDSARFMIDSDTFDADMYAVNYNILRIENGMGGLMYSN